jgi:hypothetical protein
MSLRLRFAFDVDFDSRETAQAFAVSLGWQIGGIVAHAEGLSEAPAPAIVRHPFLVAEVDRRLNA